MKKKLIDKKVKKNIFFQCWKKITSLFKHGNKNHVY